MRALWLAIWVLLGCVAPATAQTVVVRSGNHAEFTRLTFALPPGASWQLRDDGAMPRLVLSSVDPFFDISTVFQRIDRTRLRGLRVEGAEIAFDLACPCDLNAFDAGGNLVAIDIRDAPSAPLAIPVARELILPEAYSFGASIPDPDTRRPAARPRPAESLLSSARPDTSAPAVLFPGAALLPALDSPALLSAGRRDARVDLAREALELQVSRAATAGMIDLARPVPAPPPAVAPGPSADAPVASRPPVSLSAMTALDLAAADRRQTRTLSVGRTCLQDKSVAIGEWSGETDFATGVSGLRARLFGEFDQIDEAVGIDLARRYLHFGFGREALQVLSLLPDSDDAGILSDMARVVEDMPPRGVFADQASCEGDVALWSMLAEPTSAQELSPSIAAVERAFMRMPPGLQTLMGDRLAVRLMAAGADDAADRTLRRILRSTPADTPEALLARAGLAAKRGTTAEAEETLLLLAQAEAAESPGAVVKLSDLYWTERRPPAPDLVGLSVSLATELRRSDTGRDLRLAQMRLQALAGDYDAASGALREIEKRDGQGPAQRAHADFLSELVRSAGDADLLRHALTAPMPVVAGLPDTVGNRLAERLIDLGFPAEAERFLQTPPRTSDGTERHRLHARAAIAQGDIARAEAQLADVTGPEAELLLAEVLRLKGNVADAAEILRRLDDPSAERLSWIADRPAPVAEGGDASDYAPLDLPTSAGDQPELAAASDLLDRSQTVRDWVGDLLARHAAPPG